MASVITTSSIRRRASRRGDAAARRSSPIARSSPTVFRRSRSGSARKMRLRCSIGCPTWTPSSSRRRTRSSLRSGCRADCSCWRRRRTPLDGSQQNDPVRALLLIEVKPLAVVAPHALALDDLGSPNRTPLARLLADLAGAAFLPAFDAEHRRHLRDDAERGADGAEKAAVEIADEDRRRQQHAEADPHRRRAEPREHPERLRILHRPREIFGRQVVADDQDKEAVLDPAGATLERRRRLDTQLVGEHGVHDLCERAEGADTSAVQPSPEHGGDDDEAGEEIPGEAELERRKAEIGEAEDVADRDQAALVEPHVADGDCERDVLEANALAEKADERQRNESGQQCEIDSLRT